MENKYHGFIAWFKDQGGTLHPSIHVDSIGSSCTLSVGPAQIPSRDRLVSCPTNAMITYSHARASLAIACLVQSHQDSMPDIIRATRFFLVEQYRLGQESFWWPYIKTLPQPGDGTLHATPLFSENDMEWVAGTNLGKATTSLLTGWRKGYEDAVLLLERHKSALAGNISWDLYLWAAVIMTSRSFPKASPLPPYEYIPTLIPGLDLLNHSPTAEVQWHLDDDHYIISTKRTLQPGEEVFNSYGPRSNEQLMIGYGFCLVGNPDDWFGLGFNRGVSDHIRVTKQHRSSSLGDEDEIMPGESRQDSTLMSENNICEQHTLRIKPGADNEKPRDYFFSTEFLEHSAIAMENSREQQGHRQDWSPGSSTIHLEDPSDICRNKLHVLASTTMLLDTSLFNIGVFDQDGYREPTNERQHLARIYRDSQIKILQETTSALHNQLQQIMQTPLEHGILRLEYLLQQGPKVLLKDYRQVMNVALGTRVPEKVRASDGEECAFSLWLCGLYLLIRGSTTDEHDQQSIEGLKAWMSLLIQWYGDPSTGMRYQYVADGSDEFMETARSYQNAIQLTLGKYPNSLYAEADVATLAWCIHIVSCECVRLPVPASTAGAQDDEVILFMERAK